jgi:hypothetical protein
MEDLLIAILQGLFEFALEVLANIPFDWPLSTRKTSEPRSLRIACFLWFVGGCLLGALSILLLKHTWIRFSPLRIANLPLAPWYRPTSRRQLPASNKRRAPRSYRVATSGRHSGSLSAWWQSASLTPLDRIVSPQPGSHPVFD